YVLNIFPTQTDLEYRCINLGRSTLPFFILYFSFYYPFPKKIIYQARWLTPVLIVPVLISLILTDPLFYPQGAIKLVAPYLVSWMALYLLWGYWNLLSSFRGIFLQDIRKQLFLLTVGIMLISWATLFSGILYPVLGKAFYYKFSGLFITCSLILVSYSFIRYEYFQKQLKERNSRLNREITAASKGYSIFSHAIKNYLSVIDYLASDFAIGDYNHRMAKIRELCQTVSERLSHLDLSVPTGNWGTFEPISPLLEEVKNSLSDLPPEIKINLEVKMPVTPVYVDKPALVRVFQNLIRNAVEAMPNGGDIYIEAHQEGDYLMITITDQGIGIEEQRLGEILWPFQTSKSIYESWGLGLSYCQWVLSYHGGGMTIESAQGRGTVIRILLSVAKWRGIRNNIA
ncbi:MAG TPA: hypothetical protein DEB05_09190, partial [Firmicutes bacterium]|nr:hypothetical protein [Bacillota bacterium]